MRKFTAMFRALLAGSLLMAGALSAGGLDPGDRVAIIVPEVGDFISVFFALAGRVFADAGVLRSK